MYGDTTTTYQTKDNAGDDESKFHDLSVRKIIILLESKIGILV